MARPSPDNYRDRVGCSVAIFLVAAYPAPRAYPSVSFLFITLNFSNEPPPQKGYTLHPLAQPSIASAVLQNQKTTLPGCLSPAGGGKGVEAVNTL